MPWVDMTFPQASVRCVWITLHSVLTRGCSLCWMSWMHLRGDHTWLDAFGSGLSQGISDENAVRNILHLCSKAEAVSAVHVSELRAIAPLKSCCESKSLARWPRLHMIRGNGGGVRTRHEGSMRTSPRTVKRKTLRPSRAAIAQCRRASCRTSPRMRYRCKPFAFYEMR